MENFILHVDKSTKKGPVRRLNGVGGGPVTFDFSYDATSFFQEANIPFSRLHDIEYPFGSGEFVDIHNLFPDFDKDENNPENYNFALTDEYLKCVEASGAKPLFRLGNSIEHQPIKRYIVPPKDFQKWGRICSHIISHYNEGWANGFYLNIEYWEIWNEPDIEPCWTGTHEQIIALYDVSARIIKKDHPNVKIGGLAFANAKSSLVEEFLSYCKQNKVPLDFLSWHGYVKTPLKTGERALYIRQLMEQYGFGDKESIYDEWNYVMNWHEGLDKSIEFHYTPGEAAFMGSVMTTAQNNGIDIACYYDAQMLMERVWNGLFAPGPRGGHGAGGKTLVTLPGFYALKYWGALLGNQCIATQCDAPSIYTTASLSQDENEMKILISNFEDKIGYGMVPPPSISLELDTNGEYIASEAYVTDAYGNNTHITSLQNSVELRGYAIALVTLRKK